MRRGISYFFGTIIVEAGSIPVPGYEGSCEYDSQRNSSRALEIQYQGSRSKRTGGHLLLA